MRIDRTKNASRNIVFGAILKVYQIFIPFFMRTAMIYFIGVEYLGLNSLFGSILQVLNLMELGVGSAMVYSMYKPIAEDDQKTICALMNLYRFYYCIIGAVLAGGGIVFMPFIPNLIRGDVPDNINVYTIYLLNLGATVLSYWLFAYKNALLQAHQRIDVTSKVTLITNTFQYAIQFLILCIYKDYYLYLITALATQALNNLFIAIAVDKLYPNYKPIGNLDKDVVNDINGRIKDLFTSKLGMVIVNSTDTIVISAFLGLTMLAIYQNYYFILTSIIGLVTIIFNSCTAGIGNSLIVETQEKNYKDLKKFTFLISWIAGFCTCCFLCLYQPFMKVWVGEELKLNFSVVICLCIYYFIYEINQLLNTYKDAGGIWHQDRFRPLITALANLGMSLLVVRFWGIYGVILSTVLSMLMIGMPWLIYNLFVTLFTKKQLFDYLKHLFKYVITSLGACVITGGLCYFIELSDWMTLIVRGIICCIVPNIVFLISYYKMPEFRQCMQLIDKITKGKIKFTQRFI